MTDMLRSILSPGWPIQPITGPAVVLLLHGYRSNEHDLVDLVPSLGIDLPWASLRAPLEFDNGAAAWFNVTTPGNPDEAPVLEATASVWNWVDAHVDPGTRVIPIGFSQGGLMATQLLRTRPNRVLAPIVLGGFVLADPQAGDEQLAVERPAVFWGRGAEDRVMTLAAVNRTADYLPKHTTLTERTYQGLAHGINAAEMADVRDFLSLQVSA